MTDVNAPEPAGPAEIRPGPANKPAPPPKPKRGPLLGRAALAAALLAAGGAGAGATALATWHRQPVIIALTPAPIAAMKDRSPVAIKGQVAEIFGNKIIVQDDSGRALVETGRQGEGGTLVAKSETVTVQGRFDRGFIHAYSIQHGDGQTVVLGPPGPPPPHGPPPGPPQG